MSVQLTARDFRSLTGLQGRGFNKGSTSHTSGVLQSYRSGLPIDINTLQPSELVIGSGGLFVDGSFVENTDDLIISTDTDGTFVLACTVDLANNSAIFELLTSITTQSNLTATNTGVHQFQLGTVVRTGGVISNYTPNTTYIVENLYDYINSNFYSRDIADDRHKRIVDINTAFSDSDFSGMNMAQIIKFINNYMGTWGHTFEIVGEVGTSLYPNVYIAVKNLVNNTFGVSVSITSLKFKMNRPRRIGLSGCDILEVGFNNGDIYYLQYDNYGTNWETVDSDAFRASIGHYGNTYVNILYTKNVEASGHVNATSGMTISNGNLTVSNGRISANDTITTDTFFNVTGDTSSPFRNKLTTSPNGRLNFPLQIIYPTTNVPSFNIVDDRANAGDFKTFIGQRDTAGTYITGVQLRGYGLRSFDYGRGEYFGYQADTALLAYAMRETMAETKSPEVLRNSKAYMIFNKIIENYENETGLKIKESGTDE